MIEKNDIQTYFEANIEFTGNTLNLIDQILTDQKTNQQSPNKLLGIKYPQYTRMFTDLRFYFPLNKRDKIVNRVYFGLGIPYGNSTSLPYQKRFFSGGASSLRGFQYHTIGPGAHQPENDNFNIEHTGDLKLEGNLEYRFYISKIIKGAVFIDAGNIWLLKENPAKPEGRFQWNTFYEQIAISSGIGIRFDVSFFVLRVDLGFPLRRPYLGKNQQWFIDHFRPGNAEWRKENMVLNLAIGYPF
jgi:outer membrane protein assembly factor BamA